MAEEKFCSKCKTIKQLGEFHKNRKRNRNVNVWCKNCISEYSKQYRQKNRQIIRKKGFDWRQKIKRKVLAAYGLNNKPICVGCGIDDLDVLTLDHRDNNGKLQRKLAYQGGTPFYGWLFKNHCPNPAQGYYLETLCANCQLKKEILYRKNLVKI
jgi:hypothetical protein